MLIEKNWKVIESFKLTFIKNVTNKSLKILNKIFYDTKMLFYVINLLLYITYMLI